MTLISQAENISVSVIRITEVSVFLKLTKSRTPRERAWEVMSEKKLEGYGQNTKRFKFKLFGFRTQPVAKNCTHYHKSLNSAHTCDAAAVAATLSLCRLLVARFKSSWT